MIIYPAIDLINGECVRLTRGDFKLKKKYSSDPVKIALQWRDYGAMRLHIVDLDGARTGILENLEIAEQIKKITGLYIQYGGGIRDLDSIERVLNSGIDRAIIGTSIFEDEGFLKIAPAKYKNSIIFSLDFDSSGKIYKRGWQSGTDLNVFDFVMNLKNMGIEEMILTNISKDGTLVGVEPEIIRKVTKLRSFKFIIAGGIGSIEDIIRLKEIEQEGISGVIIGKALYEEKINLRDAIRIAEGSLNDNKKNNSMP